MCVYTDTEDTSNRKTNVKAGDPRVVSVLGFLPQLQLLL